MRVVLDGFVSLLCAVTVAAITGIPMWYTNQAIVMGIAPQWVYGVLGALFFVSVSIVLNLVGKAMKGIGPLRERRRS